MPSDRLSKDHTHDRVHTTYLVTLGRRGSRYTGEWEGTQDILADRGEDLVAVDHDRECSALIELLPGLLKLEKGLCRGPESAPRGT